VGVAGRGLDCGHPPDHTGDRRLGGRQIDGDGSMWELASLIRQQIRFFVTGQAGVARHPLEVDLLASPQESVKVRPYAVKTMLGPIKRSSVFRYRQSLHTSAIGCSKPYVSRTPNVCPALFFYGSLKESKAISRTKLRPLIHHSFKWSYLYKSNIESTEFRINIHHLTKYVPYY